MNTCKKCEKEFEPIKGLVNYCSLKCRNSRNWSDEDKQKKSKSAKNSDKVKNFNKENGFNRKGKHYKPIIINICSVCNKQIETLLKRNQKYHAKCALLTNGGYRKESSKGKSGQYKGYWCDSSWELAWVIYHLENNIKFERNKKGFEYEFEGKIQKYYPDFILENGIYIEIKGFERENDKYKWISFSGSLKIIFKDEIKKFLDYTVEKYGKNFIELYEDHQELILPNNCKQCDKFCKGKFCSNSCTMKYRHNNKN